jgi:hypothetical protein
VKALPIRALYSLAELVDASGVDRRILQRALTLAGVPMLKIDRLYYVSLPDLEGSGRALWESIQTAQVRCREVEDDDTS